MADHLSRLVHVEHEPPLQEAFPNEHLFAATVILPWYVNVVNFLVTNEFSHDLSKA